MIESEVLKDFKKLSLLIEAKDKKIADLKAKLAEKEKEAETYKRKIVFLDKKIKELKEEIKDIKNFYSKELKNKIEVKCIGATENFKKQLRHEICEKIRKEIKQLIESKDNSLTNWEYANGWCSALQYNMAEILQKIEKGEE